ncbi:MAG: hypothetical protein IPN95_30295 [Bacteroidetes bacterium]|nr:hypothetical protein [Bacteroidota bacterium]
MKVARIIPAKSHGQGCAEEQPQKGIRLPILAHAFSPRSKEEAAHLPQEDGEIDILIATDCISESGLCRLRLPDKDWPYWNPVRIIQRFGRVDRHQFLRTV